MWRLSKTSFVRAGSHEAFEPTAAVAACASIGKAIESSTIRRLFFGRYLDPFEQQVVHNIEHADAHFGWFWR